MQSMSVMIVEDSSSMSGVQYSTLNFLTFLENDENFDPLLLIPSNGEFSKICIERDLPFKIFNKSSYTSTSIEIFNGKIRLLNIFSILLNLVNIFIDYCKIKKFIIVNKPQVVLTKGLMAHFYGGLAANTCKTPVVWYVQDEISSRYGGIFRKIFNYLAIRIPVKLIVDGKTILSYTVSEVQRKSSIILNGIEPSSLVPNKSVETLKTELKIPQESLVIGNIARLTHWKGQHVLINAFSKYKIYNQNAVLVLVGSPLFYNENYHKFLKDKVANLALSESVIFTGFRRDLGELLSIMDMFIYPSIEKDTSPISLISAMVYGLPIAVSDIESLKDCYEGCNDIEVFESQNEDALFQIIDKIGKSDNRENMGESIKYWAEDKFSSIKQNNKITELFQELCR